MNPFGPVVQATLEHLVQDKRHRGPQTLSRSRPHASILESPTPPPRKHKNAGLPIKIHRSSRRGRKTTLWLKNGDTLVWASKRTIGTKQWHKLKLATATSVQVIFTSTFPSQETYVVLWSQVAYQGRKGIPSSHAYVSTR